MSIVNVEIKTRSAKSGKVREILKERNARYVGTDHQVDTYFNVVNGRLKLREGKIENALIYYDREDKPGPKKSDVKLYRSTSGSSLKSLLNESLGILAVVDKIREIYFIENVKFHIDTVKKLGSFVEIEAIDEKGNIGQEKLHQQCKFYLDLFGIKEEDLVSESYSDLIIDSGDNNSVRKGL